MLYNCEFKIIESNPSFTIVEYSPSSDFVFGEICVFRKFIEVSDGSITLHFPSGLSGRSGDDGLTFNTGERFPIDPREDYRISAKANSKWRETISSHISPHVKKRSKKSYFQSPNIISDDLQDVLEFGVFNGESLRHISKLIDVSKHRIFGFDTFTGLPEAWNVENVNIEPKGFFSVDKTPEIKNVSMIKGLFADTIPEYKKTAKSVAYIHIDCDLYSSTNDVFYGLNDLIFPGTIIDFDEWNIMKNGKYFINGEAISFLEWVRAKNREFEFVEPAFKKLPILKRIIRIKK